MRNSENLYLQNQLECSKFCDFPSFSLAALLFFLLEDYNVVDWTFWKLVLKLTQRSFYIWRRLQIFVQNINLYVWNSNEIDVFAALIYICALLYSIHVHMRIFVSVRVCENTRILSLNTWKYLKYTITREPKISRDLFWNFLLHLGHFTNIITTKLILNFVTYSF